ncbi:hypothetical protein PFISCL1PPCAC_13553, partial [Pristionchus fissidentatus]
IQISTFISIITTAAGLFLTLIPTHPDYFLLFQQSIYFLFAPRAIVSMLLALCLHPSLKKTTKQLLSKSSKLDNDPDKSSTVGNRVAVTSIGGKPLNFMSGQERDLYFKGYADAWMSA